MVLLKNIILAITLAILSWMTTGAVQAQETQAIIYFFWGQGCPHCQKEEEFLDKITPKYPNLEIQKFEIFNNTANRDKMIAMAKERDIQLNGVPLTIIGNKHVTGFLNQQTTGQEIESAIIELLSAEKIDGVSTQPRLLSPTPLPTLTPTPMPAAAIMANEKQPTGNKLLTLPVFGEIDPGSISLPLLTIMIGALDGFNPCAMWALVFLISLLLGLKDKKRMWILGTTFIIASGLVYFLFLTAWLNIFLFIGMIFWVRLGIGILALVAGGYYLKNALQKSDPACKVSTNPGRRKIFDSLKLLTQKKQFAIAFFGIIALAFAVNLVELFCSAGLPAVYTQLLAINQLTTWQYYSYLGLYILIFMLDDLIVFFAAMITLKITGVEGKYARFSHLVGGILMLIIGILMLFKPAWLSFS